MKMPGKFNRLFGQKQDKIEVCLAILFEQTRIIVAAFSTLTDKVDVLAFKSAPYSGNVSESIKTIDSLLSSLSEEVNEVEHANEVIFGFPQEYISDNKIKPEISDQLKDILKKLSLEPKGYVAISEALAYYLSSQSGSQESTIFVGVYDMNIRISLVKIGKIIEEKTVSRTDSICFDIESSLNSFNQEVLPAKITLYNGSDNLINVKEELLSYPWEDKANFLHFPKIEILPSLTTLQAVVGSFTQKEKVVLNRENNAQNRNREKNPKENYENSATIAADELGFTSDDQNDEMIKDKEIISEDAVEVENISRQPTQGSNESKETGSKIKTMISKFKIKKPRFPGFRKIHIILPLIVLVTAGGIWFGYSNYYSSAITINILVDPQTYENKLKFTLDPEADSIDVENKIIPGEEVSVTLEGEKSKKTEGTELVGDAAKGIVTVYNKSTSEKSFSKGDILTFDNIKFALDEDIKIASATEKIDGLTFGKTNTGITAVNIGPKGNISSGTDLDFEGLSGSSYSARANEDFSGGSSREISVVSKNDLADLRKSIIKELNKKAKQEIESKTKGELTIIEDTLDEKITKETPGKKVGEQAKEVSLKASITFTALAYNPDDIVNLLRSDAETNFPEGFSMREGVGRQTVISREINKDGSVSFESSFATTLIPDIDPEEIKSEAVGKNTEEFESYLRGLNNIGGFEIILDNKLPFLSPTSLPTDPADIDINIVIR